MVQRAHSNDGRSGVAGATPPGVLYGCANKGVAGKGICIDTKTKAHRGGQGRTKRVGRFTGGQDGRLGADWAEREPESVRVGRSEGWQAG